MTEQPNALQSIADRYGVGVDAVRHLVRALEAGHGRMAQFNHPDLGGFGQWSGSGMTMIGDMFNGGLKARVDALCTELANALPAAGWADAPSASSGWPRDWGLPATSGSQNGTRYAYFPARRRLAVEADGHVTLYDTGEHDISGVSQQQGGGTSLRFSGRGGDVDLASLRRLDATETVPSDEVVPEPAPEARPSETARAPAAASAAGDLLGTIERLSDLRRKGILTEAEFAAKKAELLARL
ncbi:SHOCT domain-containing protein [Methylobacterium sp. J-068]|uniref:SHOCT domain-containing protein n=1 Tax=Methylobacterium sp. J-068 TaxID=2836649 RepID=UPI001FBA441E|nr:SHOCT domain-containing protein [Methylobacterium sp. J-068]MCJ2035388.1 SHOCT domain-containing protein [Methylobacterium sp. J-068]